MTVAQLLDALRAAHRGGPDGEGATVQELAAESGLSIERVRGMLRPMVASGQVRHARKRIVGLDGVPRPVASYVFVDTAPAQGTRRGR